MATFYSIQMDFSEAKRQANSLDEIAQNLRLIANGTMQESMTHIASNWRGENSKKFIQKQQTVTENIKRRADELERIAEQIRLAAKRIYEAEMDALQVVNNNSFGGGDGGGGFR